MKLDKLNKMLNSLFLDGIITMELIVLINNDILNKGLLNYWYRKISILYSAYND